MQSPLSNSLDRFDELSGAVLNTLAGWRIGGPSQFAISSREQWLFDFDTYRNDGRTAAVRELLEAFSEKFKQAAIHTLGSLAGLLIMSSERYDRSVIGAADQDLANKVRHIAAILRTEFES